jgi:hypothetical protein
MDVRDRQLFLPRLKEDRLFQTRASRQPLMHLVGLRLLLIHGQSENRDYRHDQQYRSKDYRRQQLVVEAVSSQASLGPELVELHELSSTYSVSAASSRGVLETLPRKQISLPSGYRFNRGLRHTGRAQRPIQIIDSLLNFRWTFRHTRLLSFPFRSPSEGRSRGRPSWSRWVS